jgi:catechol 2,3-dioxygenase-like lactoylglutathione lyase family enzyme
MKVVPIMRCKDMEESLSFYTGVLDFELKYPESSAKDWVVDLISGEAEIQLSRGDGIFGNPVNVNVQDVDALFKKYLDRGLDTSGKPESPVHQGPLDQTWGMREFYVNDPNGNTLRFRKPID